MRSAIFAISGFVFFMLAAPAVFAKANSTTPSSAGSKQAIVDYKLFDADDLKQMTPVEQEQYLEALRNFFEAREFQPPSFSAYFLDEILGGILGQAANVIIDNRSCNAIIADPSNPPLPRRCYGDLENALKAGTFQNCVPTNMIPHEDGAQQTVNIACGNRNWTVIGTSAYVGRMRCAAGRCPEQSSADAVRPQAGAPAQSPPAPAGQTARQGSGTAAPGASRPGAAGGSPAAGTPGAGSRSARDDDHSSRCYYAGFGINRKDGAKCSPIVDACNANHMGAPSLGTMKDALKCSENPKRGICGGSMGQAAASPAATAPAAGGASNPIRGNSASGNKQVVCNPVLYGLKNDVVICVPRNSKASESCGRAKNDDTLMKFIQKDGKAAFDQMIDSLNKECRAFWNVPTSGSDLTEKAGAAPRSGDTNATDFKDTCKTLLQRALEIGSSPKAPDSIKKKVEDLRKSPQAPTQTPPRANGGTGIA